MMEESTPRTSAKWKPRETFASAMGTTAAGKLDPRLVADVERRGSVH
jgi:SP family sugar:H+ symporter-like MFS transporter